MMRPASTSLTRACLSAAESFDVSTRNGVGAKRSVIFCSWANPGAAPGFRDFVFWAIAGIPATARNPKSGSPKKRTDVKYTRNLIRFSRAVGGTEKPIIIAGSAVAANQLPEVQFILSMPFQRRLCNFIGAAERIPMRKLLPWLLLACLALPPALPADTIVEEIIARINNQIITRTEYLRSKDQLKQEAQQQDPSNADKIVAEKDKDVLRDLIDQQLLLEKGKDLGITADTEVIKRLDEMRKEMKLESMEELEKAAAGQGISFEDFKQNMKNQIITQQVISKEVGLQDVHRQGRVAAVLRPAQEPDGAAGRNPAKRTVDFD